MKKSVLRSIVAMMTVLLCTCFTTIATAEDIEINEKNFPDPKFREEVIRFYDVDNNGVLNDFDWYNRDQYSLVRISSGDFEFSLQGIEHIKVMDKLWISAHSPRLSSIDLSGCPNLEEVDFSHGLVDKLILNGSKSIKKLKFVGSSFGKLQELDTPSGDCPLFV